MAWPSTNEPRAVGQRVRGRYRNTTQVLLGKCRARAVLEPELAGDYDVARRCACHDRAASIPDVMRRHVGNAVERQLCITDQGGPQRLVVGLPVAKELHVGVYAG